MNFVNTLKYYLGFKSVARKCGKYIITKRELFVRHFYDKNDDNWWMDIYGGSYFETEKEAFEAMKHTGIKPV